MEEKGHGIVKKGMAPAKKGMAQHHDSFALDLTLIHVTYMNA